MNGHRVEVVRWGIIGSGDVAEHKSGPPLYQTPGSELIAVMRRDQEKAADFAHRHSAKRWYSDVETLLADPEINAIYIASPHHLHPSHATKAAQAGKIVLCEKPMGISSADAQGIVDACKACGVPLSVAYYRRFWPITQRLKDLLENSDPGKSRDDYLVARVLDKGAILDVMGKLKQVYPNVKHVERPEFVPSGSSQRQRVDHRKLNDLDLFDSFCREMTGEPLTEDQRSAYESIVDALRRRERES